MTVETRRAAGRAATVGSMPPVQALISTLRFAARLFFDRRCPWPARCIVLVAIAYCCLPFDFVIDPAPLLGQADDFGVFLAAVRLFLHVVPLALREEHVRQQPLRRPGAAASA